MASHHIEDTLERLRSEFLTIPSLSLTPGEVARILNVDPPTARNLVHALEESKSRTSWHVRGMDGSPALCHVPNYEPVPCADRSVCRAADSGWRIPTKRKRCGYAATASTN